LIFIDRALGIDFSWFESFGDSSVCLSELAGIKLRFGLEIERDRKSSSFWGQIHATYHAKPDPKAAPEQ
jgi:hypothetical protein